MRNFHTEEKMTTLKISKDYIRFSWQKNTIVLIMEKVKIDEVEENRLAQYHLNASQAELDALSIQ